MEPFRIGNECPVHPIAGNLPWEPSDFHMKRKGLAASCGESIRADWTGRALARPCGPDRRGQLGRRPVPGLRTAIITLFNEIDILEKYCFPLLPFTPHA